MISFVLTTLDGYHAGPNGEIDWHNVDQEFNEFAIEQGDALGALVFGRVTYELMASYWPTPEARESDPVVAGQMNGLPKVVVSRTLDRAEWANTRLVNDDVAGQLAELKRQPGKDIGVFGSSNLTASLLGMGLVDEVRILVNPVLLGAGKPLFETADRTKLKLLQTRTFASGNVLLTYRPA
jgi:dihydrofolate reductase